MSKVNCKRKSCKDVFNAFLVEKADYDGYQEMPKIYPSMVYPEENDELISFSECVSSKEYFKWVHFYEDDYLFEWIWNNPKRYLPILKKHKGVILPDFSIYRDMALPMQEWNVYRSRAIGCWLQQNCINVVVNIRWGDERTYDFCCNGAPEECVIAIGSYGNIKAKVDSVYFYNGLEFVVKRLKPKVIIVYGSLPKDIIRKYQQENIKIIIKKPSWKGNKK